MEKINWQDNPPDGAYPTREAGGLDAARGLLIGLAISQVFWVLLAIIVLR